jgi:hypothetical protein
MCSSSSRSCGTRTLDFRGALTLRARCGSGGFLGTSCCDCGFFGLALFTLRALDRGSGFCDFVRSRFGSSDFGCGGGDIGRATATTYRLSARRGGSLCGDRRRSFRNDSSAATTPRGRHWRRLLLGALALLPLPARADTRDLVIGEGAQMTAHLDVHRAKQSLHFVDGNPELDSHVIHEKLAQNHPPMELSRSPTPPAREYPSRAADRRYRRPPYCSDLQHHRARRRLVSLRI